MLLLDHLPKAIRLMRERAGFRSQNAAAKRITSQTQVTIHQSMLSHWERGRQIPSLSSLAAFLEGLGYTFLDLENALHAAAEIAHQAEESTAAPESTAGDSFPTHFRTTGSQVVQDENTRAHLRKMLNRLERIESALSNGGLGALEERRD